MPDRKENSLQKLSMKGYGCKMFSGTAQPAHLQTFLCIVQFQIHTPLTEGIGISWGWGGKFGKTKN